MFIYDGVVIVVGGWPISDPCLLAVHLNACTIGLLHHNAARRGNNPSGRRCSHTTNGANVILDGISVSRRCHCRCSPLKLIEVEAPGWLFRGKRGGKGVGGSCCCLRAKLGYLGASNLQAVRCKAPARTAAAVISIQAHLPRWLDMALTVHTQHMACIHLDNLW